MESSGVATVGSKGEGALPSGEVAFLFTDIEGSTLRWDRDAGTMAKAVRHHDQIMRAAIGAHKGHIFKTIGDAFCAAFWNIEDGLQAALDAQRTLVAEDFSAVEGIRVRMALHVGASDERDGDYFGPTLNRVARLLAVGHGGQILVSGLAAERASQAWPTIELRDLGNHRLKDLTAPEHVFQLLSPNLLADFPELRSLSVLDNNLPLQLTSLVGREHEVAEIKDLLSKSRLITLSGSGGVGKTRCAIQVAAEVLDGFVDGVWFVDLAPLANQSLVPNVIASVFGIQEASNQPMLASLVAGLKNKRLLLVVDNCEHVIEEAAKAIDALLRGCSRLSILATSREGLGIGGESLYRMPSLAFPQKRRGLTAEAALAYGAVALFEARARAANSAFTLSDDTAPIAAEICRRLDGIPLAIELAAARVKVLSIPSLAKRLDERFKLLTGGSRTALPRQQTMRALIDWSYDLLSEQEQLLLRRFSIFSGSFALDLATTICASDAIGDFEVIDLLTSLVDKSLVSAEYANGDSRYRLLESTRHYAREKLVERGEYEALARRHATAYITFAEDLGELWDSTPDREWLARAEPEMDNWRAAIAWAAGPGGDTIAMQRLARATAWLELARAEGRKYVRAALEVVGPDTPKTLAAQLELAGSKNHSVFGQFKAALDSAQRALAIFEELGDELGVAQADLCAGRALLFLERIDEGEAMLRAALDVFRRANGRKTTGSALSALGTARIMKDDIAGARSLLKEAAAIYEATGAEGRLPAVLSLLAEAEFRAGDADAALQVAAKGAEVYRTLKVGPGNLLLNMAAYLIALRRFAEARENAYQALLLAREEQADADVAFALQHLAAVAALREGDGDEARARAARVLGFVNARLAEIGSPREYTEAAEYERMSSELGEALGTQSFARLMDEGGLWNEDRAVAEALEI